MSITTEPTEPVVFDIGEGREFSYNPDWKPQTPEDRETKRVEEARAIIAASEAAAHATLEPPYKERDVAQLKQLAKDRGLSLEGLKKKSELIALLEADDAVLGSTTFTGEDAALTPTSTTPPALPVVEESATEPAIDEEPQVDDEDDEDA